MSSMEIPFFQKSGQHPCTLLMPTPIVMTVVEILQRAAALPHTLTLVDNLLVQSVEPMMRWLNMDIESNEEFREGSGTSR